MKNLVKDDKCSLKKSLLMGLAPVFKLILTSIEDLQIDDW